MTRLAFAALLALPLLASPDTGRDAATDRALAGYAARIAQVHRDADSRGASDPAPVAADLREALAWPHPDVPEAWDLRADLHARLSQVLLAAGRRAEATAAAAAGLSEGQAAGRATTVLTAQLWLRFGEAQEASGEDLEAVKAYQAAIECAKKVLAERSQNRRNP